MFKNRIFNCKVSWIAGEGCQRLDGRAAETIRIGVVFGRRLLQHTEDLFLSQLLVS